MSMCQPRFSPLTAIAMTACALLGTASAHAADLFDRIKAKREIVIGTEARYPPFEFIENGKIVGYSADLIKEIMTGLPGVAVKRLDVPWTGILSGIETSKFDFVITSVTATRERANRYALSLPIADATSALVKRKGNTKLVSPNSVGGLTVGAQTGAAQLVELQKLSAQLKANGGKPIAEIRQYADYNEAYSDLAVGRLDAVSNTLPSVLYLTKTRANLFERVPGTFGVKLYFSWIGRKDADSRRLVEFFNNGIAQLNKSGKMAALQQKWFGFQMKVPADTLPLPAASQ